MSKKSKKAIKSNLRLAQPEYAEFYWAYGSNLNVEHMAQRCPGATKIAPMHVNDAKLIFRGVADVTFDKGGCCPGGLWRITPECETALDRYEGVASKLYLKRYIPIEVDGKRHECLFYQMSWTKGIQPPNEYYAETIIQGYKDFGLDPEYLFAAIDESWNNKQITDRLRRRYERKGRPNLYRAG
jgi:hypothetical protein